MLGTNIKELRKNKGYSQETFAQELNVVRQTVSKWEKGYSVPDALMLEKMAEILDVSVGDLLGTETDSSSRKNELEQLSAQLAVLNDQIAREMGRRRRNRKILLTVLVSFLSLLLMLGCVSLISNPLIAEFFSRTKYLPGDVSRAEVLPVDSKLYSEEEICEAIDVIREEFVRDWDGCVLKEICYAGDKISRTETEDRGVETIVLISSFDTLDVPDESGLNANSSYTNWKWILVRTPLGGWRHIDHGYV